MADFEDARTLGNAAHTSSDLQGPLPSWEQPAEMLDGFDQFLQMLPNLTAPAVPTNATVSEPEAVAPSTESASTTQRMTAAERRRDKQKNSQKRFRERQKVCCDRATGMQSQITSPLIPTAINGTGTVPRAGTAVCCNHSGAARPQEQAKIT